MRIISIFKYVKLQFSGIFLFLFIPTCTLASSFLSLFLMVPRHMQTTATKARSSILLAHSAPNLSSSGYYVLHKLPQVTVLPNVIPFTKCHPPASNKRLTACHLAPKPVPHVLGFITAAS